MSLIGGFLFAVKVMSVLVFQVRKWLRRLHFNLFKCMEERYILLILKDACRLIVRLLNELVIIHNGNRTTLRQMNLRSIKSRTSQLAKMFDLKFGVCNSSKCYCISDRLHYLYAANIR